MKWSTCGVVLFAVGVIAGCGAKPADTTASIAGQTAATGLESIGAIAATTTVEAATTTAVTTSAVMTTALATTGSVQTCATGLHLVDPDGDGWGDCGSDDVAVNAWLAQAAAEGAGLPVGTACAYPATISSGATAVVACPVENGDGSEGSWSFVLAADSSLQSSASYVETKAAPPPTAPPTLPPTTPAPPPVQPAVSTTDPQFGTCKEAKAHGYGPYYAGQDPEYDWYRDRDNDGVVCE